MRLEGDTEDGLDAAVVTPTINIVLLLHNCNFATGKSHNVNTCVFQLVSCDWGTCEKVVQSPEEVTD